MLKKQASGHFIPVPAASITMTSARMIDCGAKPGVALDRLRPARLSWLNRAFAPALFRRFAVIAGSG